MAERLLRPRDGRRLGISYPTLTSATCPKCGFKPVRSYAPRLLERPSYGSNAGRDVVAVTLKGVVPLPPMPNEPAPEVAVLPMRGWARRKSLDKNEYKIIGMNI